MDMMCVSPFFGCLYLSVTGLAYSQICVVWGGLVYSDMLTVSPIHLALVSNVVSTIWTQLISHIYTAPNKYIVLGEKRLVSGLYIFGCCLYILILLYGVRFLDGVCGLVGSRLGLLVILCLVGVPVL